MVRVVRDRVKQKTGENAVEREGVGNDDLRPAEVYKITFTVKLQKRPAVSMAFLDLKAERRRTSAASRRNLPRRVRVATRRLRMNRTGRHPHEH